VSDIATARVEPHEIAKAEDFEFGFQSLIRNSAILNRMLTSSGIDFVIGGEVRAVPGTMGFTVDALWANGKALGWPAYSGGVSQPVTVAAPASFPRRDIVQVRGVLEGFDNQQRAFFEPELQSVQHRNIDTKNRLAVEIVVKGGTEGASHAPEADTGYVKIAEIFLEPETFSLTQGNIMNVTAVYGGGENDGWTEDKSRTFRMADIADLSVKIGEEAEARKHGDADTLAEAERRVLEAQLATNTWLTSVNTVALLPAASGLDANKNYLCKVLDDPTPDNNIVWQLEAGATTWAQFGAITFLPPATATERGGVRVGAASGLGLDGDSLFLQPATDGSIGGVAVMQGNGLQFNMGLVSLVTATTDRAGAMSAAAMQRLGNTRTWITTEAQVVAATGTGVGNLQMRSLIEAVFAYEYGGLALNITQGRWGVLYSTLPLPAVPGFLVIENASKQGDAFFLLTWTTFTWPTLVFRAVLQGGDDFNRYDWVQTPTVNDINNLRSNAFARIGVPTNAIDPVRLGRIGANGELTTTVDIPNAVGGTAVEMRTGMMSGADKLVLDRLSMWFSRVRNVASGFSISAAIRKDGIWVWGLNQNGELSLGPGDTTNRTAPTLLDDRLEWTQVSAGETHMLAIRADGTLWAWGSNANGRTGLNAAAGTTEVPMQVGIFTDWVAVSAGRLHSAGIRADGSLWAWGDNGSGRTGLGASAGAALVPTRVGTATDWVQVSAGEANTMGIRADGSLWAWGAGANGRLGNNSTANQVNPMQVMPGWNWLYVSVGNSTMMAIRDMGFNNAALYSWGSNANGRTGLGTTAGDTMIPTQVGTATDWVQVSISDAHTLAIRRDGTLWAWGSNTNGATSQGSAGNTLVPTRVFMDNDWVAVSAGRNYSMAIKADGSLWAWGSNLTGRTGLNTTVGNTLLPTRVISWG